MACQAITPKSLSKYIYKSDIYNYKELQDPVNKKGRCYKEDTIC
ncbi:hypothetical protein TUM3811_27970 [Shewanella algae]|nr:hypothetical protein TUM3811_27970 [Shewanella algae]